MPIHTIAINAEEAKKIMSRQEGHFLDFKRITIMPAKLTRTMSAFANADGGELFLARIMHDARHFCMSVEQARASDPTGRIVVRQLAVRRVWV